MWPFLLEDQVDCQQFLYFSEARMTQPEVTLSDQMPGQSQDKPKEICRLVCSDHTDLQNFPHRTWVISTPINQAVDLRAPHTRITIFLVFSLHALFCPWEVVGFRRQTNSEGRTRNSSGPGEGQALESVNMWVGKNIRKSVNMWVGKKKKKEGHKFTVQNQKEKEKYNRKFLCRMLGEKYQFSSRSLLLPPVLPLLLQAKNPVSNQQLKVLPRASCLREEK